MRILQVNAVNGIMSTGRNVMEIADFLNNNGNEGYIAYSEGTDYVKGYKIGSAFEKKLHALLSRVFGLQAYFSIRGTRRLIKFTSTIKPDIIHLGNLHGNFINLKMLLKYVRQNSIPLVLTLHDCWFFTGKCTHYTSDNCYKWKDGCGSCVRLKKDNVSWFFDRTKKMLHDKKQLFSSLPSLTVIGVSDWITEEARLSILSSATTIKRIYNWIDLEVFKPQLSNRIREQYDLQNKFIILGVASGWGKAKGLDKFIELATNLLQDMVIVLVGRIATDIELTDNIIHINETHDVSELVALYSTSDVLINYSLEESFGKVTAESLACGTPVIVMNSTASPELVGEKCGYVLNNSDIANVLNVVVEIQKKGKVYYSDSCVTYANSRFNRETILNEHIDLYSSIFSGGKN